MNTIDRHIRSLREKYPDLTEEEEKALREQYPNVILRNRIIQTEGGQTVLNPAPAAAHQQPERQTGEE